MSMIILFVICHSGADTGTQLNSYSLGHQGLPHQQAAEREPADRRR